MGLVMIALQFSWLVRLTWARPSLVGRKDRQNLALSILDFPCLVDSAFATSRRHLRRSRFVAGIFRTEMHEVDRSYATDFRTSTKIFRFCEHHNERALQAI
jgi:hypothetical protein